MHSSNLMLCAVHVNSHHTKALTISTHTADALPVLLVLNITNMEKFYYSGPLEREGISEHLQLVLDKKICGKLMYDSFTI